MSSPDISTSAPGTAQHIFDTAPLGAVIAFRDDTAKPPAHHTRKLRNWLHTNGAGRLIQKTLGTDPTTTLIKLRIFDVNTPTDPDDLYYRSFTVDNGLRFRIAARPLPGSVRVMRTVKSGLEHLHLELLHLAPDMASAEAWIEAYPHQNLTIQIVPA